MRKLHKDRGSKKEYNKAAITEIHQRSKEMKPELEMNKNKEKCEPITCNLSIE